MEPRLPYDILLQIFRHLDPLDKRQMRLRDTPSSVLAIQRQLGATLSLISRDWRDVGTKYLWSNFILSFATERSRRKLVLLIGNEEIAKNVRRLYLYAGVHDVERAANLPVDFLLPSLKALQSLELSATPSFTTKIFSQVDLSSDGGDLRNLRHLVLDSSDQSSTHYPDFLLRLVSKLPRLESLEITVSLPSTGSLRTPSPTPVHTRPLQSLQSFSYLVCGDNSGPSELANPFLSSLFDLINPSPLETLSVTCRTLPGSLSSFLSISSKLSALSITCDRLTMENQLPSFVSSFSTLSYLSKLEFGILPAWTAPFHFPSTSPLTSLFFSSLSSLPRLRTVSLDFDLTSHEVAILDFLKSKWSGGVFERFEWNAWMAVSRYNVPISYKRREEGGWRREEQGNSIEIVGE
ncbi:hypothetical protein JCM5350_002328 [Sporobolomyces pararoseus]